MPPVAKKAKIVDKDRTKNTKNTKNTNDKDDSYSKESYWSKRYAVTGNITGSTDNEEMSVMISERDHDWYFSVLEIGCGMKPILTTISLPPVESPSTPFNLLSLDYAQPCISHLKKNFNSSPEKTYTFIKADARDVPLSSSSVPLVIEKGTLDAMITSEVDDAVRVLKEMARVTSRYLVVVTHFNVETEEGEEWVEDVLGVGLETEGGGVFWKVNCNVGEQGGAMVVVCEKCVRRKTRNEGGETLQIEVTEY
ncbi:hypothetical protein TrST_g4788 [Triparma strigata]|uniref:Methyltransferase type 11 domain-containing protein n=1 Tax=Triparma strigata TaxID=1606541 RepID=A0A9W7BDI8_9STRA|nr:hypothetical protein TrST_g4788 [Triparma strigata]